MITSLAQYIAVFLLKNSIIDSEKLDIYIYGFEIIISSSINIAIAALLGIVFAQFAECVIFLISFILLRKYCGGYHADTYLKCNIVFAINIIAVMVILKTGISFSVYAHCVICIICVIIYAFLSPIENKYKPLNKMERKKYKAIAITIGLLLVVISSILHYMCLTFSIVINLALISVALAMVIEYFRKGDVKDEECKKEYS